MRNLIYKVLSIAANISKIKSSILKEIENIKEFFEEVYEKCKDLDLSYCENSFGMACISLARHVLNDDIRDIKFYDEVKGYCENVPRDCVKAKYIQMCALELYCSKPIAIVPDQIKIDEIKEFKKAYPGEKDELTNLIMIACETGNIDLYRCCSEIRNEMNYYESHKKHSQAFEQYVAKNYRAAETMFSEIIRCGIPDLEDNARVNLAFMVRRGEVIETQESFLDLLQPVSDTFVFKHMNVALFCIKENLTGTAMYQSAISALESMSEEEKVSLIKCWGDPEFVGSEEHKIAMNLINGTEE